MTIDDAVISLKIGRALAAEPLPAADFLGRLPLIWSILTMRFFAAFAIVFAFSATSFAEHGVPDSQTLSAMGLADMQILTDHEGLAIRGKATGAKDREPSDKMLWYQQGTEDFRLHVSEYKERLANRSSAKADWYRDARTNYRSSVASFKSSIGG